MGKESPRYLELETFRRSVNRKIWTVVTGSLFVSVLCVGLAFLALVKPVPVVAFDGRGRPILFEDTISPRLKLEQVRVEYFAHLFLARFVGVDSAVIERDMAEAINMMTPRLKEIVVNDPDGLEKQAKYAEANIRSRFRDVEMKVAAYDDEKTDARIHLIAWGAIIYEPRVGAMEENGEIERYFHTQMVLQRVPITDHSIHGVLVDFVNTKFFDSEDELRVFALKRRP